MNSAMRTQEIPRMNNTGYVVLTIDDFGNGAFADLGRDSEIARIIGEAASRLDGLDDLFGTNATLRDFNGNRVGSVLFCDKLAPGETKEGSVRLSVELGNAAFEDEPGVEVARILRDAAGQVRNGSHAFSVRDFNGNTVGKFELREEPSLDRNGVINMEEALAGGHVFGAEGGYSGIADGEFRFAVTKPPFEVGYHQGQGEVWLVNAKGEKAPGHDEPQTVKESMLRELKSEERGDLRAVVEGRLSFDDFEHRYGDDDPSP
jgi:hypothetical protein